MRSTNLVWVGWNVLSMGSAFDAPGFEVPGTLLARTVNGSNLPDPSSIYGPCSMACEALLEQHGPSYVLFPNETTYTEFQKTYWSNLQVEVSPLCVFEPPDVEGVKSVILTSQITECPFAFKSGGHSAFAGAASSNGGITVSLKHLNDIVLSEDKKIAYVGPGNIWLDVYTKLAEDEVTVVGGRVANIGVGGLTLGGGISFFSGFHGWACDNVEAYEVVLASGEFVITSPEAHPDLYWALRGGGNNFGIVTRFHLRTIPIPGNNIWAGTRTYLQSEFPGLTQAFTNLTLTADSDPQAGFWAAFLSYNNTKLASTTLWYSNPANITVTPVFDEINKVPSLADSTSERNLVQFVSDNQKSNPDGFRDIYSVITTKASADLANFAVAYFFERLPSVINIPGIQPVQVFQPITKPQIVNMRQNGGNPLGLDPEEGPLFIIQCSAWWSNATDDDAVYAFVSDVQTAIIARAKELGVYNKYLYMNYASQFQDVVASYGEENKQRLIEISEKYDPEQVFQKLQPGYFKLNGPPVVSSYFSNA